MASYVTVTMRRRRWGDGGVDPRGSFFFVRKSRTDIRPRRCEWMERRQGLSDALLGVSGLEK